MNKQLQAIDHIAIPATNIAESVKWYTDRFQCNIAYQDETWAMLEFNNIKLAFVLAEQHPGHIAFKVAEEKLDGDLRTRRDGERSYYRHDCADNVIEWMVEKTNG